jgi:stage II sporulation protein D
MINKEPMIHVGLLESQKSVHGIFHGDYQLDDGTRVSGNFVVTRDGGEIVLTNDSGKQTGRNKTITCRAMPDSQCRIHDMTIGRKFHWERTEDQFFGGNIIFQTHSSDMMLVINEIFLEEYLASVISSEMSASAPSELLQAHAIISRSWMMAMIERMREGSIAKARSSIIAEGEIIRWYGREDHSYYDVCADDHCQRYHGVSRIRPDSAVNAVRTTRGRFLLYGETICDARYSKCCGGWTEKFEAAWEDTPIPYLTGINDSPLDRNPLTGEREACDWILSTPDAYCHTNDESFLGYVLPSFDQETKDFYRWRVSYDREELEDIIKAKSGIDFGTLMDCIAVHRGSSGRITRLKIIGTGRTLIVGKELEIRRWLSKSHLKSSAFVVETERDVNGIPLRFTFRGAGWGHGVGLCQIGAAVMAVQGIHAENILNHYYKGARVQKLY